MLFGRLHAARGGQVGCESTEDTKYQVHVYLLKNLNIMLVYQTCNQVYIWVKLKSHLESHDRWHESDLTAINALKIANVNLSILE